MYARDIAIIATPIGSIRVEGDEAHLLSIRIVDEPASPGSASFDTVKQAIEQLQQWFAGERTSFDLGLAPAETYRSNQLRQALIDLPFGSTMSYGGFARLHGSAPRAVGQLCARNPFPLVVPCHRITASGGKLGNYTGGKGPETKAWLLEHERIHSANQEKLL